MPTEDPVRQLLEYWIGQENQSPAEFGEKTRLWYTSNAETDEDIRRRFGDTLAAAERGELEHWRSSPDGVVALVILLDQFSRNLYRGTPDAFRNDVKAQELVTRFIEAGGDDALSVPQKLLLYHPLHHAEDVALQQLCVTKFRELAAGCSQEWLPVVNATLKYSEEHCEIIERFGRFPHRNGVLGRQATQEEQAFLDEDPRDYGQARK